MVIPGLTAAPRTLSSSSEPSDYLSAYNLLGSHPVALIVACFTLDTFGQATLVALLATLLLSCNVRPRNATLINLLVVTVLCSVPPVLLFYTDQYLSKYPPRGLCMLQAFLKHGTDPMFVVASLALVIEFLQGTGLVIVRFMSKKCLGAQILVAAPYVTFVLFTSLAAGLGGSHPSKVIHKSNEIFCSVDIVVFVRFQEAFIITIVAATIVLEAYTFLKLRRTWEGVKRAKSSTLFTYSQALRVAGFTILQLNFIILSAIDFYFCSVGTHVLPIVYEALMPLGTFFIFGTTTDCLSVWMCCRGLKPYDNVADKPPASPNHGPPSQVINIDFNLSLIPGFKTPSDFMSIDIDALQSPHPSSHGTNRFTLNSSRRSRTANTPSILRNGDGLSLLSSGDRPPLSLRSEQRSVTETKPPPIPPDGATIASSTITGPITPAVESPFVLTLSLPPPGLALDLNFNF